MIGRYSKSLSVRFGRTVAILSIAFSSMTCKVDKSAMTPSSDVVRVFLSGDVMLGRGVDQILAHRVDPILYEGFVKDARTYVHLAEQINGPMPKNRTLQYVWGDAIEIFAQLKPDVKVINLETSVTDKGEPWPGKGIHYRMHPSNAPVITAADIDCCVLNNNHVLDWGYAGFNDTLQYLHAAKLKTIGAGLNSKDAREPAIFDVANKCCASRLILIGAGSPTAGVFYEWAARSDRAGVRVVDETDDQSVEKEVQNVKALLKEFGRRPTDDVVVYSVHWGGNWGWDLEQGQRKMARRLIDEAGVDLIHGHSSHHIKGVEIYNGKLIIYGCGDLLSDYEGIQNEGEEKYRNDLSFMYFVNLNIKNGTLSSLQLVPMRLKHMQLKRAVNEDRKWLFDTMKKQCAKIGGSVLDLALSPNDGSIFELKFS